MTQPLMIALSTNVPINGKLAKMMIDALLPFMIATRDVVISHPAGISALVATKISQLSMS